MFDRWSAFPTDKSLGETVLVRYKTILLGFALSVLLLRLPHVGPLIAGWSIFWYGVFRFWLRDVVVDDEEIPGLLTHPVWARWVGPILSRWVLSFAINLVLGILWLEFLGDDKVSIVLVVGCGLLASMSLVFTVQLRSLRRYQRRVPASP